MSKMTFGKTFIRRLLIATGLSVTGACQPAPSAFPVDRESLMAQAVLIEGGEYETGSRLPGSWPERRVTLKPFYIWPTEITGAWWQQYKPRTNAVQEDDPYPVTEITYDDAAGFCEWLSGRFQIKARLPTVEEWMVAAQAGTPGMPFPWGWGSPAGRAVFSTNATQPVARHPANAYGLFDLSGNAAEWAATDNPITAPVMGGSWAEQDADYVRIHSQMILPRMYKGKDTGFRIVMDP